MKRSIFFAALVVASLAGCAQPSAEELSNLDYGFFPDDYESVTKSYLEATLKDPASVIYREISHPKQAWIKSIGSPMTAGYLVCYTYNAKNSYGGYVGFHRDAILIKDGVVIRYLAKGDWFGKNMC